MISRQAIYRNYVSLGFGAMNSQGYDRISKAYALNYDGLIRGAKDSAVLDIGCGMGHFLHYLKSRGFENLCGVDIGKEQVEYCRRNAGVNALLVDDIFRFLDSKKSCYDFVALNDVLEHFSKDEITRLLSAILVSLREKGRVIIKTPNMGSIFAPASFYIDFTHETGFSEISLPQVLKAAGFKSVGCRAEKVYIASPFKRALFSLCRGVYFNLLKFLSWIDRPGDGYPAIFSKNLIAWAEK